jgi:ABC-2 type transport system ATP-binding protein
MKQRVKLAQSIVHDPELVFLDEPTAGLDPKGREEMLELVERIYKHLGIAVVFSSHILEDIELVCDYVVILDGGRLMTSQPLGGFGDILGEVTLRIDGDQDAFAGKLAAFGVPVSTTENATGAFELAVTAADERVFDLIRDVAVSQDVAIRSLRSRSRSLEDIYLSTVGAASEVEHGD